MKFILENPFFVAENNANPYDITGILHNEVLKYVSDKEKKSAMSFNIDSIIKETVVFLCQNRHPWKEIGTEFSEERLTKMLKAEEKFFLSSYEKKRQLVLGNKHLSKAIKFELAWLLNCIEYFDPETDSLLDYIQKILNWEHRIVSANYSKDEQQILLSAASICRHSTKYWIDILIGETSPSAKANCKKGCRTVRIIAADVLGGIAGAVVFGATYGVPGAVVGAIGVGGAASMGASKI